MTNSFALPASITIDNATAVRNQLNALQAAENGVVTLDASAIEHITTPSVQLLAALDKQLEMSNNKLVIKNPSSALKVVLTLRAACWLNPPRIAPS